MKILAIPATNSPNGRNRRLIDHAARLLEGGLIADATVDVLDLNDYEMPLYSFRRQDEFGIPDAAQRFFDEIGAADAVIVSFAEHNGSYTVAWKNVYDWASRIAMGVYQERKVALFAAAPGARGGQGVLDHAVVVTPFFGGEVVGSLAIPRFDEHFDSVAGELVEPDLRARFEEILAALGA